MIGHDFPYLDTRDLNLDWLLRNMKQILADWAEYQASMNQNFSDLESAVNQFESDMTSAFDDLHDYVQDYFNNLDVQQEINNKLNAMKSSGELAEIMNPLIASETATWLSTHITNPSNPPIDTSLSVSGAAADAKVTGDRLSDLKNAVMKTVIPSTYSTGYIGADGSAATTDTNYYFCDYIKIPFAAGTNIKFKVSMLSSRGMAFYDGNKTFISAINGNNCSDYGYSESASPQEINVPVPNTAVYVRITQRTTAVSGVNDFGVSGINSGTMPEYVARIPGIETELSNVTTEANKNTLARNISVQFTAGGYITAGGIVSSHPAYSYTDFIYIGGMKSLKMPMFISGSGASIVLFNKTKAVTRYFQNPSDPLGTVLNISNIADDEVYIKITCYTSRTSDFYMRCDTITESIAKTFRVLNGENDVPFSKIIHDGGMIRIFNTIGVIGDSLSSGEMAYGNASGETTTEYTDMYQYSWIQYIARSCGITAFNFSQGGMNTENFLSGTGGQLAKFQNPDNKCQAYFIALGHNDYNYGVPIGSPSDINISDPTQDPDTYYGNYAHIIALIKQIQPNAKIFCICMKSTHFADYNAAIRYMPSIFSNVYVLDFETYYPLLESSWEYTQGHGNAMGYLNYSWQIGTYVDWIIRNNRTDFKYVQFIGTPYDEYIPTT